MLYDRTSAERRSTGETQRKMKRTAGRILPWLPAASVLTSLSLLLALGLPSGGSAAPLPTVLGVDVAPSGNTATSLGTFNSCVSVSSGVEFLVDVVVGDVADLKAWELEFVYDPQIIEVVDRDLELFLASRPGSNLVQASEPLPDGNSRHFLGAADIEDKPESGSGVLARLILRAKASGVSPAGLSSTHSWPRLTNTSSDFIGDTDGSGSFDGTLLQAQIAVDASCASVTPVPSPGATPGATPRATPGATPAASPMPGSTPSGGGPDDGEGADGESSGQAVLVVDGEIIWPGEAGSAGEDDGTPAPDTSDRGGPATSSDSGGQPGSHGGNSSGDDFPLWAIGLLAAIVLVGAGGGSVYFASRFSSRPRL